MTISTRDLSGLPDIAGLKALSQSIALLDAILSPEWEYRYYSFNAKWRQDAALASMRDGQGDQYFCIFTPAGAILKGFAHESPLSPFRSDPPRIHPGILDGAPLALRDLLDEPAFAPEETTFCIWRGSEDRAWQRGDIQPRDADGSAELLSILDGNRETYRRWAEMYYERPVSLGAVERIYWHEPLTKRVLRALNPDISLEDLHADLVEIGYREIDQR